MHIGAIFGAILVVGCSFVWFLFAVKDLKISKGLFLSLISLILLGIVVFGYFFEAIGDKLDLSRHYDLLNKMREGGWNYAQNESQYKSLYVYNTFAYIIAVSGEYALLQTIPLIIDCCIFLYIYLDVVKRHHSDSNFISAKDSLFVFFLWIATFGLKLAIIGIRCVLAVALCALAIYQECIRGKHKIFSLLLYLAAIFTHNFAVLIIIIRVLSRLKFKKTLAVVALFVMLFGNTIFELLRNITTNDYLRFIFTRLMQTFDKFKVGSNVASTSGTAFVLMWGGFVLITVYLIYVSVYTKTFYPRENLLNKKDAKSFLKVCDLCYTIGLLGLPMFFNYLYMERYMYIIAWAFLMIGYYYVKAVDGQTQRRTLNFSITVFAVLISSFVLFFNDIYQIMVNYIGFYFLGM